jgi:Flp pilus assembly protein TadD
MTVDELFKEAQRLHREGQGAEAEVLYRRILSLDGEHADTLHYLGVLHMQQGALDLAETDIRRAVALKPREPAAHVNLGLLLLRRQRTAEAATSFRNALAIDPFRAAALTGLAETQRSLGQLSEAVLSCRKAVAIEPRNAEACFAGRVPVFIGDDRTDEDGFKEVLARGGHAVQVGPGLSAVASSFAASPAALRSWLKHIPIAVRGAVA